MAGPVRLGLAGAGRWGRVYLRTLEPMGTRGRVTHLATSKPENAAFAPDGTVVLASWRELVASDCDAVIIATPPASHAEILDACLNAGKPCLVEKPLCLDVAEAERLDAAARRTGVPVLVDHIHLFDAGYEELSRRLRASGEPVRTIVSESGAPGPVRSEVSVLWDRAPHDISLVLDLMQRLPERVEASGGPDAVELRLGFSGNSSARITTSRVAPAKQRRLSVDTESTRYALDELAEAPLRIGPKAGEGGTALQPVPGVRRELTLPRVVAYFLDGLAGGDRRRFGLGLGVDVVRVLAQADAAMAGV